MAAPKLPVFIQNFVLPAGSQVTGLQVNPSDLYTFNGTYYIAPVQPPCPVGQVCDTVAPNPAVYNSHTPYPAQNAKIIADRYIFDQHVVSVAVCPFKYIPDVQQLALYRQVNFNIQYTNGSYTPTGHISEQMQSLTKNFVKDMVVNPQSLQDMRRPSQPPTPIIGTCTKQVLHWQPDNIGDRPDYIIITNNALKPYFIPLATYKTQRGIPTVIATVEDIYSQYAGVDHAEQIRNYLKDVYNHWGTLYVLLGGDSSIIPAHIGTRESAFGRYFDRATDLYYSDVYDPNTPNNYNWNPNNNTIRGGDDIVDAVPDLILGRLPVKTTDNVTLLYNKIYHYEYLTGVNNRDYVNNALFLGAYISYSGSPYIGWGQNLNNQLGNNPFFFGKNIFKLYDDPFYIRPANPPLYPNPTPQEGDDTLTRPKALQHLNYGNVNFSGGHYHFISHADHGAPYQIGVSSLKHGDLLYNNDADIMSNAPYYQIMFTVACEPGEINKDNFAGHYIQSPTGGGVAIVANSGFGWSGYSSEYHDVEFFREVYNSNNLGLSFISSQISYINTWNNQDVQKNITLFGDPTMQVWTDAPQDITLSVPTDVNIDNGTNNPYTVQINDLDEPATITVYKYNEMNHQIDVYGSQTVPEHTTSATFYLQPDTEGDLTVTATAKNYIPATATTHIHLPQAHLYVINTAFNDANGNGAIEPGETVDLNLTLTNSGGTTIDNVQTVLEPDTALSGLVTVTQANVNANGSFAPGSHQALSGYQFQVGSNSTMPRYLKFWLNITGTYNNNSYQHRDEIYLDMTNTTLSLGAQTVTDTNNNIILNANFQNNVNYNLEIKLKNENNIDIQGIQAVLSADDPNSIEVLQNSSTYPIINANSQAANSNVFSFKILQNNGSLPMTLTVQNQFGQSQTFHFDLMEPYPVIFSVTRGELTDINGNVVDIDDVQENTEYNLRLWITNNSFDVQNLSATIDRFGFVGLVQNASTSAFSINPFQITANSQDFKLTFYGVDLSYFNPKIKLNISNNTNESEQFTIELIKLLKGHRKNFRFTSTDHSIKLMWAPAFGSYQGYNIYRSDMIDGPYTKINDRLLTGSSMYEDTDVEMSHTYYYKISVVTPKGNEIPLDKLLTAPDYEDGRVQGYKAWTTLPVQTGFPVQHALNPGSTTAPTLLDINGDSHKEIFVGMIDWRDATVEQGRLLAYDSQGHELFNIDGNTTNLEGFALLPYALRSKAGLYDIDGDGHAEVFAMSRNNSPEEGRIYGFHTIDTHPNDNLDAPDKLWDNQENYINVAINGNHHRSLQPPVLADVNNDGVKEIIMLDEHQSIHIYNSLTQEELYNTQINGFWFSETEMAVADLDHDGFKEIVFVVQKDLNHNNHSAVYYTHYNGTDFETVFVKELNGTISNDCINRNIILGDIDPENLNQNQMEIFVIGVDSADPAPQCIPHQYSLYGLRMNGDFISPQWNSSNNPNLQFDKVNGLSMGDVNGDGKPEVVVANGSQVSIFDQNANRSNINLSGNAIGEPIIADVDTDADMEIVINTGHFLDAYNADGTLCGGWHIPGLDANKTFAQSPYVGDIDNDGKNEVVIADNGATIYAWKTTGDADKIEWGTARYNAQNTGAYESLNQMDLMVKDSPDDTGVEPNTVTQRFWESEDIWIRNHDDGGTQHENPEYDPSHPVYVYVRVTNRGDVASTSQEKLHLYWANANTDLEWPTPWDGQQTNNNNAITGNEIGVIDIPILQPGEQRILKMPWHIPNVDDYDQSPAGTWHFCLLARIASPNDQMTFTETTDLPANVANNNNIAWKNVTVIDVDPNLPDNLLSGSVVIGNWSNSSHLYFLELVKDNSESGNPIFKEAEVKLKMSPKLYEAWKRGGKIAKELESTNDDRKKIVKGNNVLLKYLAFDPKEFGVLTLTFNFLTKKITAKDRYKYHLIQRDAQTGKIIGGETFIIRKKPRPIFIADAQNQEVDKGDLVTLSAENIGEAAIYNWYDMDGNLVYQGKDMEVSADMAKKFKLEVIATADGFKDYKNVEIKLKPNRIVNLTPNPVANNLKVSYKINKGSSAYLILINVSGNNEVVGNYVIDVSQDNINIDMSHYPAGVYSVALVTDGQVTDVKELAKN